MSIVIAAHDLSGVGRCSLGAAMGILPAFGHCCQPLPTAVLNKQTAFAGYSFLDFTPHMREYISGWEGMDLSPAMIYTGFLGNAGQVGPLKELIWQYPDALCVVDPVMGDDGKLYPCFDESFAKAMRELAKSAHILLPNMTEFNLITGADPEAPLPDELDSLVSRAAHAGSERLEYVVVTSAKKNLKRDERALCNLVIDLKSATVTELECRGDHVHYSGTGDLFASCVCALLLNGYGMVESARRAAEFVSGAVELVPQDHDPRLGIPYERVLSDFAVRSGAGQCAGI